MKCHLIIPPSLFLDVENYVPPLGLLYVQAALKPFFDAVSITPVNRLVDLMPEDVIGVTGVNAHSDFIDMLPTCYKNRMIAGGPYASIRGEQLLKAGYHNVVVGEIESCATELIHSLLTGERKVVYGDSVELPNVLLDFESLQDFYPLDQRVGLMTSRGCKFSCHFCTKTVKKHRLHDLSTILANVEQCIDKFRTNFFIFYDDDILATPSHFAELCRQLPLITWRSQVRSTSVTEELLVLAKESGCVQLSVGVESGSQHVLDSINKRLKVEDNSRAIQLCRTAGIQSKAFIMLGLPGESPETLDLTRRWLFDNRPDIVSIYIYQPLEGSYVFSHLSEFDLELVGNTGYYAAVGCTSPCCVKTSTLNPEDITAYRNRLVKELKKEGIVVG